jgi:hypothetical protein
MNNLIIFPSSLVGYCWLSHCGAPLYEGRHDEVEGMCWKCSRLLDEMLLMPLPVLSEFEAKKLLREITGATTAYLN